VAAQGKAKDKALSTAFVTFKDTFTTTIAATSMMHHDLRHWSTREAPAPRVCIPVSLCGSISRVCRLVSHAVLLSARYHMRPQQKISSTAAAPSSSPFLLLNSRIMKTSFIALVPCVHLPVILAAN